MTRRFLITALSLVAMVSAAHAGGVVLNEYNAVAGSERLSGADTFFGSVDGNGGDWIELVVVDDHLDMRGWALNWADGDGDAGVILLSDDAFWSNMRRGTLITIIEEADGGGAGLDTSTDTRFNPAGGDWWVNICTTQEQALHDAGGDWLTRTDDAGRFKVNDSDWALTILNGAAVVFGPAGEGALTWPGDGVNDREAGKLEGPAAPASLADWLAITPASAYYDDGDSSTFGAPNTWGGGVQDLTALRVPEPAAIALLAGGAVLLRRRRT